MSAKPLPAYDDIVERYGLNILKTPGDLVVKDGDIAVTKTGDLMLNSPNIVASRAWFEAGDTICRRFNHFSTS